MGQHGGEVSMEERAEEAESVPRVPETLTLGYSVAPCRIRGEMKAGATITEIPRRKKNGKQG
jgi:hypothetical protein